MRIDISFICPQIMPYNGQGQVATCPYGYPFPGKYALEDAQSRKRSSRHMPTRKFHPKTQPVRTSRDLSLGFCPSAKYALEACPNPAKFACWGIRHPAYYALKRARTSRDLSLRISFSRKICHPANLSSNHPQKLRLANHANPQIRGFLQFLGTHFIASN